VKRKKITLRRRERRGFAEKMSTSGDDWYAERSGRTRLN
jgi:hypothetical protein